MLLKASEVCSDGIQRFEFNYMRLCLTEFRA